MKVSKRIKSIISVIVVVAMVITMLPQGQLVKAATEMNINIHFYDTDQKYAGRKVLLQYLQRRKYSRNGNVIVFRLHQRKAQKVQTGMA